MLTKDTIFRFRDHIGAPTTVANYTQSDLSQFVEILN